jgi:hypothetical protein
MLSLEFVTSFIYENFQNVKVTKGGKHFQAKCSLCGDSKKTQKKRRFHLDYDSLKNNAVFHCWNCTASGDFYKLYSEIKHTTRQEAWKKINYDLTESTLFPILSQTKTPTIKPVKHNFNHILKNCYNDIDTPIGIIQESLVNKLKQFRKSRLISDDIKLYIGYTGEYNKRIIVPVFEDDNLVYFQARSISDHQHPKYLNPAVEKEYLIPNKNNLNWNEPIVILEGLIDSWSINNGTCMLGKELSDVFMDNLITLAKDKIIICYDNDEEGKNSLTKYINNGKYRKLLYYYTMPKKYKNIKDLNQLMVKNSFTKEEMTKLVLDNSHSFLITKVKLSAGSLW